MTSPYEPPLASDYLFVKLTIQPDKECIFRDGMRLVKPAVFEQRLGWTLIRAGKRILTRDADDGHVHFVHLWQANNPINVWQGQFTVASNSDYAALYRAVDAEEQQILRIPAVYAPTKAFAQPAGAFMAIQEITLVKDWSSALDWQWTLPVAVGDDDIAPQQFSLSFAFQTTTGALRNHVHFFEPDDAVQKLAATFDLDVLSRPRNVAVDNVPDPRDDARIKRRDAIQKTVTRSANIDVYERVEYPPL